MKYHFPLPLHIRLPFLLVLFLLSLGIAVSSFFSDTMKVKNITDESSYTEEQKNVALAFKELDYFDGTIITVTDYPQDPGARHLMVQTEIPDIEHLPANAANAAIPVRKETYYIRVSSYTDLEESLSLKDLAPGAFVRIKTGQSIYSAKEMDAKELSVLVSPFGENS